MKKAKKASARSRSLHNAGGTAVAAVAVAVPTTRFSQAIRKEIASALLQRAKELKL